MNGITGLLEKTYFYPVNHGESGDVGHLLFQSQGDGLYPLIRDGDILHIHATSSDLHVGDLALLENQSGQLCIHLVLAGMMGQDGAERPSEPARLVGRIAAIGRNGQTKRCNDRLARLAHITYFVVRPFVLFVLVTRKILSLFQLQFFVKDAESSLQSVAQKFNEDVEVFYYSERALEGLDEQEQHLVEQYMRFRGRVLNIGCGAGREAFALAELRFQVVGIDVAPRMVEAATRLAASRGKNICFEVKSVTNLNYAPNSFDYVFMSEGVYSLIPTRDLRIHVLRNIEKLLAPDGTLLFSALYRRASVLSRVFLYDVFRRIAKRLLGRQLHSEPGDTLVRYVSHASKASNLCYVHLFADADEVWKEVSSAGLDGFEDKQTGYWVVRSLKEVSSQATIRREVTA
jgi:SAM-dependent methyltransferase